MKKVNSVLTVDPLVASLDGILNDIGQTINHRIITDCLRKLESTLKSNNLSTLATTTRVRVLVLEKVHQIYLSASQRTALPNDVWGLWVTTVEQLFDDTDAVYTAALEQCIQSFDVAFKDAFWGTRFCLQKELSTFTLRFEDALERMGEDELDLDDNDDVDGDAALVAAVQESFSTLQWWSSLAFWNEHQFELYGFIGNKEREIIEAKFFSNEKVDTMLTRRSFKRDAKVPFSTLRDTLEAYNEFETDEKKKKEIVSLFNKTLRSKTFQQCSPLAGETDDTKQTLMDTLVKEHLNDFPHRAFALSMQRLTELESFPPILNPSRLEFFLHILRKLVQQYSRKLHRWSAFHPFSSPDDTDWIQFILSRHLALLRISLLFLQKGETGFSITAIFFNGAVYSLRLIVNSLVDCLHLYLNSPSVSKSSEEKRELRRRRAIHSFHEFFETVIIDRFARGLLNEVYTFFEAGEETIQTQLSVFTHEAELKLMLCDFVQFLTPHTKMEKLITDSRNRLLPLAESLLEFLNQTECSSSELLEGVLLLLRVLDRLGRLFSRSTSTENEEFLLTLQGLYKQTMKVSIKGKSQQLILLSQEGWERVLTGLNTVEVPPTVEGEGTVVSPLLYSQLSTASKVSASSLLVPQQEARRDLKELASSDTSGLKRGREE